LQNYDYAQTEWHHQQDFQYNTYASSSWLGFANEDFMKDVHISGTCTLMADKADSRPADTATGAGE
jgi:hypothetical protein